MFLAGLLPASELAVGVVNYFVTLLLPPRTLPKLDFKKGIPLRLRDLRRHADDAGPPGRSGELCWSGWKSITWPIPIPSCDSPS